MLSLGPKFVPYQKSDLIQIKVDILNFSRILLLKAQFYKSNIIDNSLIKPVSNYVPKCTKYPVLKSIVEDLEILANDFDDSERLKVKDNLNPEQRKSLENLKHNKNLLYFKADKGTSIVLMDSNYYREKIMEKLSTSNFIKLPRNIDYCINLKMHRFVKIRIIYSFILHMISGCSA